MAAACVSASSVASIRATRAFRSRAVARRVARLQRPRRAFRAAASGSDDFHPRGDASDDDMADRLSAPLTPGDLHRAAAAAAAAAAEPHFGDYSADDAAGADDYPFSLDDAATANNSVGPAARGVCWSNLQDLEDVPDHEAVFVLVFGAGTGSEGLYSLQERTKEDVPVDIILAFPAEEDAARYGTLLEAEMGRVPVVESARPEDLRYTCREGGYRCKVARRGVLLMPPEKTVEVTDWERTNALRQGHWSVDQNAGSAAQETQREAGCRTLAELGEPSGDDLLEQYKTIIEGYCESVDNDDELCALPTDYDEAMARQMLARLFEERCDPEQDR